MEHLRCGLGPTSSRFFEGRPPTGAPSTPGGAPAGRALPICATSASRTGLRRPAAARLPPHAAAGASAAASRPANSRSTAGSGMWSGLTSVSTRPAKRSLAANTARPSSPLRGSGPGCADRRCRRSGSRRSRGRRRRSARQRARRAPRAGRAPRAPRCGVRHLGRRRSARRVSVDQLALPGRQLAVDIAEEHDVVPGEQRRARPQVAELVDRVGQAEHVRHAHPVEGALHHALRGVQVGVGIEVERAYVGAGLDLGAEGAAATFRGATITALARR